jgi:class 3 adenylate cyclase
MGDDGFVVKSRGHFESPEHQRQVDAVTQDLPRRLVAVMFTDVVGYTALIQADELAAVDKRDRYIRAIERHHQSFDGTIVQRLGDGTMSMFPSALAAVQAAVAIQRELVEQAIPVRIGIHSCTASSASGRS